MTTHQRVAKMCIQSDWNSPVGGGNANLWISYSQFGKPTIYGDLAISSSVLKGDFPRIVSEDNGEFHATLLSKNRLQMQYKNSNAKFFLQSPSSEFSRIHNAASVPSLDVSCGGELGVSCDTKGRLLIWNAKNGQVMRTLEGHLSNVTQCRFFPSGLVVLSGSDDMQLKVWSAEDSSCPVTFTGHKGAITSTAFVERGRHVISGARDGSARLWDCSASRCVSVLSQEGSHVSCCGLVPGSFANPSGGDCEDTTVTGDGLLVLGHDNGLIKGVDVHSRTKVVDFMCSSAVCACAFLDDVEFVAACEDGALLFYDLRHMSVPLRTISIPKTRPLAVSTAQRKTVAMASSDGCVFSFDPTSQEVASVTSHTGPDCDPVYDLCFQGNTLYTACRDGKIRKYIGYL